MPFGFSILDYVVVAVVALMTLYFLSHAPHRMLVWLPTFLTIDFFIPLGTQLTPARFVPLMIGGWLVMRRELRPHTNHLVPILLITVVIAASAAYALNVGDAGIRPILRAMHYFGLIFLFIFLIKVLRKDQHIELALWGLFIAGLIHGGHALYQLVASMTGLPFRGIVYSTTSEVAAAFTQAGLRVNGFADEPKRLGYVLFCAVLSAGYFALWRNRKFAVLPFRRFRPLFASRWFLLAIAGLCLLMSLLTYSGSYLASVAMVLVFLLITFSSRTIAYAMPAGILVVVGIVSFPAQIEKYQTALIALLEDRAIEFNQGLVAQKVYRQELFAYKYMSDNPASMIFGLGIGRYNRVLADTFGDGAGYDSYGDLLPLNSQVYELGFDLGVAPLLVLYVGGFLLAIRVGRRRLRNYAVSTMLLFLIIQSLFIENKHILVFVAALSSALILQRAYGLRTVIRRAPAEFVRPTYPQTRRPIQRPRK